MERVITVSQPVFSETELLYLTECIQSNWLTQGKRVARFEELFAAFCKCAHGVATTSGTTALHLLLKSLDIGPGDEVIVPNLTFVATANAVTYCGATPVLVDVESSTWNLDPLRVEEAITRRTQAIIAVHLYGLSAEMHALREIANKYDIYLIEDAAEAIGATYHGQPVGSLSDAAIFSFYGNKTITTGEGGMVVTNDHNLVTRLRYLRGQAQDVAGRYFHSEVGFNYRMTDMQAAIGCAQMEKIGYLVERRQSIWETYASEFGYSARQHVPIQSVHAGWMFVVLFKTWLQRIAAEKEYAEQRIETRPVFLPLTQLPMYSSQRDLPVSEDISARGLCLPTHPALSNEDLEKIIVVGKKVLSTTYVYS